jgi:hypothetical protein
MADMTATQREALSGMNLSDHEKRMKELEAELEAVKARIAETKANIANLKADKKLIESAQPPIESAQPPIESAQPAKEEIPFAPDRGLTGIRDEDGTLITAKDQEARLDAQKEAGKIREDEIYKEMYPEEGVVKVPEIPDEESTRERTKEEEEIYQALLEGKELTDEQYEITNQMSREDFEATGIPFVDKKVFTEDADIEGDERPDAYSEKQKFIGIDREQGRAFAAQDDLPERSMGFKDKDGYMSVDEKDDFWKTQEGYDKAIEMYGSKPAWVKEPTLIWNPVEQKYEEIEEEEFEDLSRPAISADIKKLFG